MGITVSSSCLLCASEPDTSIIPAFKVQKVAFLDFSRPDFSIIIDGESIAVHRALLVEACDYFHCLFECEIEEAKTGILEVKNIKPNIVKTVISYIYGDEISIEWNDVIDYLDIVEMWQFIELKEKLEHYIVTNVDKNSSIHWLIWLTDIAEKYHLEKLERKIQLIDARTKLLRWMTLVLDGDRNNADMHMDFLRRFRLTQSDMAFIDGALRNMLDRPIKESKYMKMQPYKNMLLQACLNNTHKELAGYTVLTEVSINNKSDPAKENHSLSSESVDTGPVSHVRYLPRLGKGKGMGVPVNSCLGCIPLCRRGKGDKGIPVVGFVIVALGSNRKIYRLKFSVDFSEISVKENGSLLPEFPCMETLNHCMTDYGMFSCRNECNGGSYTTECVLFDTSTGNCMHLPKITELNDPVRVAVCVDLKIYVMNQTTGQGIKLAFFDLKRSLAWHCCEAANYTRCYNCDVCVIGSKVYFVYLVYGTDRVEMAYIDIEKEVYGYNPRKSCSKPPVPLTTRIKLVPAARDILLLEECGRITKYSTVTKQWTALTIPGLTAKNISRAALCYLYGHLVVAESDLGKLSVYDVLGKKPPKLFELPASMWCEAMGMMGKFLLKLRNRLVVFSKQLQFT